MISMSKINKCILVAGLAFFGSLGVTSEAQGLRLREEKDEEFDEAKQREMSAEITEDLRKMRAEKGFAKAIKGVVKKQKEKQAAIEEEKRQTKRKVKNCVKKILNDKRRQEIQKEELRTAVVDTAKNPRKAKRQIEKREKQAQKDRCDRIVVGVLICVAVFVWVLAVVGFVYCTPFCQDDKLKQFVGFLCLIVILLPFYFCLKATVSSKQKSN